MTEPRTREIQLTAKQLVFVFMSTVLVAVVIFLLGVWVGRGIGDVPTLAQDATDIETGTLKSPPPAANGPAPTKPPADPPPFEYPKRLLDGKGSTTSPAPSGQSAPEPQAQAPPPTSALPPAPTSPPPPPKTSTAKPPAADGEAWVVQVGSYSSKANADKAAAQFTAKGYPVSVTPGPKFRVWIGPFPQKPAADQVANRLRKEGQDLSVIRSR